MYFIIYSQSIGQYISTLKQCTSCTIKAHLILSIKNKSGNCESLTRNICPKSRFEKSLNKIRFFVRFFDISNVENVIVYEFEAKRTKVRIV